MDVFNLDDDAIIERKDLTAYEEIFSTQCTMDSAIFIKMLKSLYKDAALYKIVSE